MSKLVREGVRWFRWYLLFSAVLVQITPQKKLTVWGDFGRDLWGPWRRRLEVNFMTGCRPSVWQTLKDRTDYFMPLVVKSGLPFAVKERRNRIANLLRSCSDQAIPNMAFENWQRALETRWSHDGLGFIDFKMMLVNLQSIKRLRRLRLICRIYNLKF